MQKGKKKMIAKQHFTTEQAREIGDRLGVDWNPFDVEQFRMGLNVELEHGLSDPSTNVTGNDSILTGKIGDVKRSSHEKRAYHDPPGTACSGNCTDGHLVYPESVAC